MTETPPSPARSTRLPRLLAVGLVLVVLVAGAAFALGKLSGPAAPQSLTIGGTAPALQGQTLDGTALDLTQLRGRAVIVNFWASWCPPCKEEFPAFKSVLARHASEGLAVVGVLFNDGAAPARAFVAQEGANWPSVLDPSGAAAKAYGVFGAPETFLIDRSGVVRARLLGNLTETSLEQAVAGILQ